MNQYDPESAILEESNALDSEPEGPYMDEPLVDDNWIAEYGNEVQEAGQRSQALQSRFDNIEASKVWTLGKQLIRIYRTAIAQL